MQRVIALNERNRRIGENHPNAKLSDADVDRIFALRESGLTLAAIAGKMGVSKSCVQHILDGTRRAHLAARTVRVSVDL